MIDLISKLIRKKLPDASYNNVFDMIEGILRYIKEDEDSKYETNKGIIGMHNLFRGYAIKVWKNQTLIPINILI